MSARLVILGAGGHARVLAEAVRAVGGFKLLGFTDADAARHGSEIDGLRVLGDDDWLRREHRPDGVLLVNGLGSVGDTGARRRLFERFRADGYRFAGVIHPQALLAPGLALGEGVQIMRGAVIQRGVRLDDNVLVNTAATVDHDCRIGAHAHLASGCVLSGDVEVGAGAHVGTGATVIQGMRIGDGALVAAGAVVVRPVVAGARVMGVPAKEEAK